jgi:hypothetical protein
VGESSSTRRLRSRPSAPVTNSVLNPSSSRFQFGIQPRPSGSSPKIANQANPQSRARPARQACAKSAKLYPFPTPRPLGVKDRKTIVFRTLFGNLELTSPLVERFCDIGLGLADRVGSARCLRARAAPRPT